MSIFEQDQFAATENLLKRHREVMRYLAALVARDGGETAISAAELQEPLMLSKSEDPFTGLVMLKIAHPQ